MQFGECWRLCALISLRNHFPVKGGFDVLFDVSYFSFWLSFAEYLFHCIVVANWTSALPHYSSFMQNHNALLLTQIETCLMIECATGRTLSVHLLQGRAAAWRQRWSVNCDSRRRKDVGTTAVANIYIRNISCVSFFSKLCSTEDSNLIVWSSPR